MSDGKIRFRLYLITDRRISGPEAMIRSIEQVLDAAGGDRIAVQLREKDLPAGELLELARKLRRITRKAGSLLLINDRADVAMACDADGVHLPVAGLPVARARSVLGPDKLLGCSTHGLSQAVASVEGGADFVTFGPVFHTPSKSAYGPPVGLDALAEAGRRLQPTPVFALGGVDAEKTSDCYRSGAFGIAVIRSVLAASHPAKAALDLLHRIS